MANLKVLYGTGAVKLNDKIGKVERRHSCQRRLEQRLFCLSACIANGAMVAMTRARMDRTGVVWVAWFSRLASVAGRWPPVSF